MKFLLYTLLVCAPLCAGAAETPQPRVCRPLTENRPASLQDRLDEAHLTHLRLMGFRQVRLQQTMDGYANTGRRLISRDDDGVLTPAECGDDLGLYAVAPVLATATGISLRKATDLTLLVWLLLPLLYAASVFVSDPTIASGKKLAIVAALLVLLGIGYFIGDLYLIAVSMAAAGVATTSWLGRQTNQNFAVSCAILFGAFADIANTFRGHSATAPLLFVLASIWLSTRVRRAKVILVTAIVLSFLSAMLLQHRIVAERDDYLLAQPGASSVSVSGHPFWHTVWISLGYVNNPYVPAVKDESGVAKVRSIDPTANYFSPEYEAVLRRETFDLVRRHPLVVAANLLAKAGTILIVLAFLLAPVILTRGIRWSSHLLPWGIAIGFSSLFGIVAMPAPRYLGGMIAFAVLLTVTKVGKASSADDLALGARA